MLAVHVSSIWFGTDRGENLDNLDNHKSEKTWPAASGRQLTHSTKQDTAYLIWNNTTSITEKKTCCIGYRENRTHKME